MKTSSEHSQRPLSGFKGHSLSSMVLSITTGPFLVGLIGARAIAESLTQLGLASEEFFRGERLPVLQTVPEASTQEDAAEP